MSDKSCGQYHDILIDLRGNSAKKGRELVLIRGHLKEAKMRAYNM
jgi:hypothetical protein